jgi:hypothetical protein
MRARRRQQRGRQRRIDGIGRHRQRAAGADGAAAILARFELFKQHDTAFGVEERARVFQCRRQGAVDAEARIGGLVQIAQ